MDRQMEPKIARVFCQCILHTPPFLYGWRGWEDAAGTMQRLISPSDSWVEIARGSHSSLRLAWGTGRVRLFFFYVDFGHGAVFHAQAVRYGRRHVEHAVCLFGAAVGHLGDGGLAIAFVRDLDGAAKGKRLVRHSHFVRAVGFSARSFVAIELVAVDGCQASLCSGDVGR